MVGITKLVSQFDSEKSRPSLATPTCGCCCCCCCCCLVSTFASASISARSFAKFTEENLPNEPEKIKSARIFGFFQPIGLFAVAVVVLLIAAENMPYDLQVLNYLLPIAGSIIYIIITTIAYNNKFHLERNISTVIFHPLLFVGLFIAEVFVGLLMILSELGYAYLILAVIIDIIFIAGTFSKRNATQNSEMQDDEMQNSDTRNNELANNELANSGIPNSGIQIDNTNGEDV